MDTLLGIAVVVVWIAFSVMALKRAYDSHSLSSNSSDLEHTDNPKR